MSILSVLLLILAIAMASATQQTQNPYRRFYGENQQPFRK